MNNERTGKKTSFSDSTVDVLGQITERMKHNVQAQYLARRGQFESSRKKGRDDTTIGKELLEEFDKLWNNLDKRLLLVSGKKTLADLNSLLQKEYKISLSIPLIVESFRKDEVPNEMVELLNAIDAFRKEII